MEQTPAQRAEHYVLSLALERGYLSAEQLSAARQLSAPSGLLPLLAQRYLQPQHAAELGQLYQRALSQPAPIAADAERTLEFSATLPPQAATLPPQAANLSPASHDSLAPPPIGETLAVPPPAELFASRLVHSSEAQPGSLVGPFRILRELARGGMGVVYEAERPGLDRRVALKQILSHQASPDAIERFLIEARIAARLRHPNIIGIHDVGESEGDPYFAMDFVEGEDLATRLERERTLPPAEAAELTRKLALALAYAHTRGVLHRDVKPANVILQASNGEPVLTDFGLAKDVKPESEGEAATPGLTQAGAVMGTPSYMPPEQADGSAGLVDRRADVYSLGATLYAMLCGKAPFEGSSVLSTITMVLKDEPIPPRKLRPEVARDLEVICLTCLAKAPEARYQSADELAADLQRYLDDEPIKARPPSLAGRGLRWVRRNRRLAALAALLGSLSLAGVAGAWVYTRAEARSQGREQAEAATQALQAASDRGRDERIGLALTALQQAQRWLSIAPSEAEARDCAFQAAVSLGAVAEEGQQWAFARQAYLQAREVDPARGAETEDLLARLEESAQAESRRREGEVRAYLESARVGEFDRDPFALREAEFRLARYTDPQVVALLVARLAEIRDALISTRLENLRRQGTPDPFETSQGLKPIPGLEGACAAWGARLARPEPARTKDLSPLEDQALRAAYERWGSRARRAGEGLTRLTGRQLLANLIKRELRGALTEAYLICSALARLPLDPDQVAIVASYANAEGDLERCALAAIALARQADPAAVALAKRFYIEADLNHPSLASALRNAVTLDTASSGGTEREVATEVSALRELGKTEEGLGVVRAALQRWPGSQPLVHQEALLLMDAGRLEEAAERLRGLLAAGARDLGVALAYAKVLLQLKRPQDAIELLSEVEADAATPNQRAALGSIYHSLGQVARAEIELRIAVEATREPVHAAALAHAILVQGRATEAQTLLESYHAAGVQSASTIAMLANAKSDLGDLTGAATLIEEAIKLTPRDHELWAARATVRHRSSDYLGAVEDFDRCLEVVKLPYERGVLLAGRALAHEGLLDHEASRRDLEEAAQLAPGHPLVLGNLARAHSRAGRWELALQVLERALAVTPKNLQLLGIKGEVLARAQRLDEAVALLKEVLEREPKNPTARGNLAIVYEQQRKLPEALEQLSLVIAQDPKSTTALLNRATIYAQLGRAQEAQADLDAVRRLEPGSARPALLISQMHIQRGEAQAALAAIEEAIALEPRSADAHAMKGMILLQQRRLEEAAAVLRTARGLDPAADRPKLAWLNYLFMVKKNEEAKVLIKQILADSPNHPEAAKLRAALKQLGG